MNNNDAIFGGNLTCRANIIAYASDIRLKENVERIPEALDKLCSLRGITFDWKQEAFDEGFTTQTRYNDVDTLHVITRNPPRLIGSLAASKGVHAVGNQYARFLKLAVEYIRKSKGH